MFKAQHYRAAVEQVLGPLSEQLMPLFPETVRKEITPQLYVTFWTLSMYDLHVPTSSYQREIEKIKKNIQQLDESREVRDRRTIGVRIHANKRRTIERK